MHYNMTTDLLILGGTVLIVAVVCGVMMWRESNEQGKS